MRVDKNAEATTRFSAMLRENPAMLGRDVLRKMFEDSEI
jgi:hypothetical protein